MSDNEQVSQALAELWDIVRCRCNEAYTGRGLHDPDCECDSAEAVKIVADRIEALEAKLATCEKYRDAYDEMGRIGTQAVRDLEGKLAQAKGALSICSASWGECNRILDENKAKLAKAEAGLLAIAKRDEQMIWGEDYEVEEAFKDMRDIALATLAEIKGESHDPTT